MKPDFALLLAFARVSLDSGAARNAAASLESPINWDRLLTLASRHRVTPLLYPQVAQLDASVVPAAVLSELRQLSFWSLANNSQLCRVLAGLLARFRERGIRVIPYKGVMIAAMAYGSIGLRQTSDLDLLVHPDDYSASRKALLDAGYRVVPNFDLGWECHFVNSGEHEVMVDVHRALLPAWFGVSVPFDALWEHCAPQPIAGLQFPCLAVEDSLIILCLQLVKDTAHRNVSLRQVCDIHELLLRYPQLDLAALRDRARRWGVVRELSLGLRVAQTVLGGNVPLYQRLRSAMDESVAPFVGLTIDALQASSDGCDRLLMTVYHEYRYLFQWRRGAMAKLAVVGSGVRRVAGILLVPTEKECALFPLPPAWSFLHYFIRPVRLTTKYLVFTPLVLCRAWLRRLALGS